MKLFIVLSCLAAVALASPVEENTISFWPEPSQRANGRIINGQNAAQNAAPFICSMRWGITNMQHSCGGSILAAGWFLTAAHCITELPNIGNTEIQCGVTHRTNDVATQQIIRYTRADAILHPGWVAGGAVGPSDIAVIRLPTNLVLNNVVQPVRQRASGLDTGVARLFGWGAINSSIISPTIPVALQTAEKDLLTMAECEARLRAINPSFGDPLDYNTNICAARGNISACGGDSGGPLVVGSAGNWVQVGVVSWGISPCGNVNGAPSVYARSSNYVPWISQATGLAVGDFTA